MATFPKDPNAVLDYKWDWSGWLVALETIATATFTADPGITVQSNSHDSTSATIWLAGGTSGTSYNVTCSITTNQGRTDERVARIKVQPR